MTGMPAASQHVQAALDTQLAHPGTYVDLADAACTAIFDITRDLERENPDYRDAFQALAERLGYC